MTALEARGWIETAADLLRPRRIAAGSGCNARLLLALVVNPQGLTLEQARHAASKAGRPISASAVKVYASNLRVALADLGLGTITPCTGSASRYVLTESSPGCIDRAVRGAARP